MSKEGLIADVKKRIETSGFPTEFKAKGVLQNRGWMLEDDDLYVDPETGKLRQGDIRATLVSVPKADSTGLVPYYVHITAECKNPKEAWVFLCHDVREARQGCYVTRGDDSRLKVWPPVRREGELVDDDYMLKHPNALARWRARKFFDMRGSVKKDEELTIDDRITKALLGAVKNLEFHGVRNVAVEYSDYKEQGAKAAQRGRIVDLFLPVVVVEGRLVRAVFGSQGEPIAEEVDRVYVELQHACTPSPVVGPQYEAQYNWLVRHWGQRYLVAVVRLDALSAFLDDVRQSVRCMPDPPKYFEPDYAELDELVEIHMAWALKRGQ